MFALMLALPGLDIGSPLYRQGDYSAEQAGAGVLGGARLWSGGRFSVGAELGVRWNWLPEAGGAGPSLWRITPDVDWRLRLTNAPASLSWAIFAGPSLALAVVGSTAEAHARVALGTEFRLESTVGAVRPVATLRLEGAPIGPWDTNIENVTVNAEAAVLAVHIGASFGESPRKTSVEAP